VFSWFVDCLVCVLILLIAWFASLLIAWLAGWMDMAGWLDCWLAGYGWMAGWLDIWLPGCLAGWLVC
jgi:hypothetical protein